MSYKTAGGAGTLLRRRNEWVSSLRESLPQFTESAKSPLQRGRRAAVFGQSERRALDDAQRASLLLLPSDWKEEATRRLGRVLHGIVDVQTLQRCDYFLCSLIHPTYVQPATTLQQASEAQKRKLQQQLRRTVCMPLELTMAGSKSLRLMHEVNSLVEMGSRASSSRRAAAAEGDEAGPHRGQGRSPVGPPHHLDAPWPELMVADTQACLSSFRESELESLVLFDKQAFFSLPPSASSAVEDDAVPVEVSLAAFTALCGSVELVGGFEGLVRYLDRIAREKGSEHTKR